jgi:COMPASS component SWD2
MQQPAEANAILQPTTKLHYRHRASLVEFNPRYNMLASADKEVIFWAPTEADK